MNKNITRGLALAALTGGFTLLGVTAANAIDLDGDGQDDGLLGTGIHIPLDTSVPVTVDGLNAAVLPSNDTNSIGNGIFLNTGKTVAEVFAPIGVDTADLLGTNENLSTIVGVPVDASNTWASVLGSQPNGVVVVPNLHALPTADVTDGADGFVDGYVEAPVDISCTSVTVLSSYQADCAGTSGSGAGTGGILDGDLVGKLGGELLGGDLLGSDILGGDISAEQPITVEDRQIDVLDGGVLGGTDGIAGDGLVVDPVDESTDLGTDFDLGDPARGTVVAPVDLSDTWVSVLGDNGGVVVVPDSTISPFLRTLGLVDSELFVPVSIDCVTITVLSDFERDCAAGPTEPTEPTVPTEPTDEGEVGGIDAENGGNGGGDAGDNNGADDPCAVDATATAFTSDDSAGPDVGLLGGAAAAGGLTALGLLALGRKFRIL